MTTAQQPGKAENTDGGADGADGGGPGRESTSDHLTPARIGVGLPTWVWTVSAVALVLFLVTASAVWPSSNPAAVVKEVASEVEHWEAVEYRAQVADPEGGQMEMTVTVDQNGDSGGFLRRRAGGRAEFRTVGAAVYIKGDRAWWQRSEPRHVDRLADIWLSDTGSEIPYTVRGVAKVDPKKLATDLSTGALWTEESTEDDNGDDVRTLRNFSTTIKVSNDRPWRLLAVKNLALASGTEVQVRKPDPVEAAAAVNLPPEAVNAPAMIKKMLERAQLSVSVQAPLGICETPTCAATVIVRNSGEITGTGTVDVTMNGHPAGSFPFSVSPGQTATFEASGPNPSYQSGLRGVPIFWNARLRD